MFKFEVATDAVILVVARRRWLKATAAALPESILFKSSAVDIRTQHCTAGGKNSKTLERGFFFKQQKQLQARKNISGYTFQNKI